MYHLDTHAVQELCEERARQRHAASTPTTTPMHTDSSATQAKPTLGLALTGCAIQNGRSECSDTAGNVLKEAKSTSGPLDQL